MYKTLLVLGLLRTRSLHGYELHRIVRSHGVLYSALKKANLYYLLDRLARNGYLEVQAEPRSNGIRGEQLNYTITEKGCVYFEELLQTVIRVYEPPHTATDIAITLLEHLPLRDAIAALTERHTIIARHRERIIAELKESASHNLLESLASDHLLMLIDAELAWVDRSLQRLQQAEKNSERAPQEATVSSISRLRPLEEQVE